MGGNSEVTLWPQMMTPSILQSEKIQHQKFSQIFVSFKRTEQVDEKS